MHKGARYARYSANATVSDWITLAEVMPLLLRILVRWWLGILRCGQKEAVAWWTVRMNTWVPGAGV